jgi:hypothetical protein
MTPIALEPVAQRVLRALYELAQLDCPAHAGVLGRAVGMRAADVARALLVLDARGLVSADRARLTLEGLACAARVPALQLERETWLEPLRRRALGVRLPSRRAEGGG